MPFTDLTWITISRLLLAGALGAILGIEREMGGHRGSIRAGMAIATGACLFALVGMQNLLTSGQGDASGIIGPLVIGASLLAAGSLLHREADRSTAADIWIVAGIGAAVGAGMELLAGIATVFVTASLALISHIERKI